MKSIRRFTGKVTTFIKGFAIILMICNDLYLTPELMFTENGYISNTICSKSLAEYIGGFVKNRESNLLDSIWEE